ncbi:MarR family winged helix-turn-helix transcriptional regulator [Sandaracinus amylolyticus]|uniref:Transcriptional regulator, MarR family protein n=1 Tax=Sandaracinus amylolyticus TaxID=927083 RepID=A0A0F6YJ51_9BACT|nr:MarR family winged helix-turn-helix transcriptional regulator [Sandaracinus amylolyticus]AKF07522.1 Transcriptional regulator, MarR family protein [Sandaracinus amylolyticus]
MEQAPPPGSFFDDHTEPLDQRIASGLAKIGLALKHQSSQAAGERGLSPTQGQILATLLTAGPMRPSALAARLALRLPGVSESARTLVEKDLVEKLVDPDDARATLLALTARGRREAKRAAGWPDFLATAVEALEPDEQAAFYRGLLKMIRTLQEREQIPVSRMCLGCTHFRANAHPGEGKPHHCALVDAPLANDQLRLDCVDQVPASAELAASNWDALTRSR